jgi:hypothetical protein
MPPPENTTPPTGFFVAGVQYNPDGTTTFLPDTVRSSSTIGMQWTNNDASAGHTATVYRKVIDASGNCSPGCGSFTPVASLPGLPLGAATWIDTAAVPNAKNCYYVADTDSNGLVAASQVACAYTRDSNGFHPARVQLGLTVGPNYQHMSLDPVFVRLQDPVDIPRGNISWLAKDTSYLVYGTTTAFDLYTFKTIQDLTDITQISIGVAGGDDLCIASMSLAIDYDGSPTSPYRVAYYQDFTSLPGGCFTVVGSDANGYGGTQLGVSFEQLRQSPDWSYQIDQYLQYKAAKVPNFDGFFDGKATRGALMGLAQNAIHAKGIQMRVDHPIELTVHGNSIRPDNILTVKAHVHKDCDAYAQVDVRLVNRCDCVNGTNVVTKTEIALENPHADVEPWSLCSLGADALGDLTGLVTLGQFSFTYWLQDYLSGKVQAAIAGKTDETIPVAPPAGSQLVFRSAPSIYGGFGVGTGQSCDTYNPACGCASFVNGACTP